MHVHEFQAKKLLAGHGVPVPPGGVARSVDEALAVARGLGCRSWVVKAQVHAGGRATGHFRDSPSSAGGVRRVGSIDELRRNVQEMLGHVLVTEQTGAEGREVEAVYIEAACDVERELFLALLLDRQSGRVTVLASPRGGVDIESVVAGGADLLRLAIDPLSGPGEDETGELAESLLGAGAPGTGELVRIVRALADMYAALDLSLIEINPLAVTAEGRLVALDAVLDFDDNALFRHPEIRALRDERELSVGELRAGYHGFNYLKLDGNIGTLANGAGLAMATVDAIRHAGGEPANFLDVPPVIEMSLLGDAIRLVVSDPAVDTLFINVFGGGIMRCDTVADAILVAHHDRTLRGVPIVVRLTGTNAELGLRRLRDSGLPLTFAGTLRDGAAEAVALAGRGREQRRASWWQRAQALLADRMSGKRS